MSINRYFQDNYDTLRRWASQITDKNTSISEDLVHEIYVKFLLNDRNMEGIEEIEAYMYSVLRNSYRSYLRNNTRKMSGQISIDELTVENHRSLFRDPRLTYKIRDDLIAMSSYLSRRSTGSISASIFILRFVHGYFPGEIGKIANRSRNSIEARIFKARQEILEFLTGNEKHESSVYTPVNAAKDAFGSDFFLELSDYVFRNGQGTCMDPIGLVRAYKKERTGIERHELAHIASCRRCLDLVSDIHNIPGPDARHPLDALRPQSTVDSLYVARAATALMFFSTSLCYDALNFL